jgi:hypothetical protein
MVRQAFSALFALLFAILTLGAAAGPALASGVHYRVVPVTAPAEVRLIVRDIVWRCGGSGCTAPQNGSRAEIVCASLAREIGALASFSAGGRVFDAAQLENCNRRAR